MRSADKRANSNHQIYKATWRTAAAAQDSLCLRAAPLPGPRAPGENLLNHADALRHSTCAPFRSPVILACPAPPDGNRLLGNPARPTDFTAAPRAACQLVQRPRAPAGTRAAKRMALLLLRILN
ncbi:MAG TPA: hypothetical protein PKV33_05595 [Methanothrix sp.]|nr:hypothetical protein [Methanothrix sp.]